MKKFKKMKKYIIIDWEEFALTVRVWWDSHYMAWYMNEMKFDWVCTTTGKCITSCLKRVEKMALLLENK